MRFNIISSFCEIWDLIVFEIIAFMKCLNFSDVVRILYEHVSFHQFHRIPLSCDHQGLAYTPKDPPGRVDIKKISVFLCLKKMYCIIDITV